MRNIVEDRGDVTAGEACAHLPGRAPRILLIIMDHGIISTVQLGDAHVTTSLSALPNEKVRSRDDHSQLPLDDNTQPAKPLLLGSDLRTPITSHPRPPPSKSGDMVGTEYMF